MSNQLTAEQQRMIEENRRKALERRALRLAQTNTGNGQASLLPSKGASERASPKLADVYHQRAAPNVAAAAAPKQFVAPVKQHESRLHGATGNHISHTVNSAPNEVSFNAFAFDQGSPAPGSPPPRGPNLKKIAQPGVKFRFTLLLFFQ